MHEQTPVPDLSLLLSTPSRAPVVIGAGMVSLDINLGTEPGARPILRAGGTCANVAIILSFLGWHAYPVAHLADDLFAATLLDDMRKWGVDTALVRQDRGGRTPLIVVRSGRNRQGKPVHRFSWRCPVCGSQLPVFLPLKPDEVRKVIAGGIRPDIFYFDRVSRSSLALAQWYRRHGAVVMFEPQWMRKSRIFAECLQAADILKASREMMKRSFEEIDTDGIPLVIETLGSGGLRYRFSGTGSGAQRWQQVAAFPVTGIADTVGAGDWCSAGLLHALLVGGGFPVREAGGEAVRTALRFGQALAALNCKFPGARGAMDALSRPAFRACAAAICRDGDCTVPALKARVQRPGRLPRVLCPRCSQAP